MFRNIGKRIRFLAILVAILTLVVFLALAVVFLVAALRAQDATTRTAGIEGAILFAALALFLPLFSFPLYGFGDLVDAGEKQAADTREIRDMLKKALSDGALSDEIARKTGVVLSKLTPPAAPRAGIAPTRPTIAQRPAHIVRQEPQAPAFSAPVAPARPVSEKMTPAEPTVASPEPPSNAFFGSEKVPVESTPAAPAAAEPVLEVEEQMPPAFAAQPTAAPAAKPTDAPVAPPPSFTPVVAKPFVPDDSTGAIQPIRPLHSDTTY